MTACGMQRPVAAVMLVRRQNPTESARIHDRQELRRILLPRPQGTGAGARAPGHVHPYRLARPHHPGSHRQRRRRGAGRLREEDPRHAAPRRLGHGGRRRPRHSGRPAPRGRRAGGGAGLHPAARWRQVRQARGQQRLRLLGRPAWCRRVGHQRAVHARRTRDQARRQAPSHRLYRRRRAHRRDPRRGRLRPSDRHPRARVARSQVFRSAARAAQ